MYFSYSRDDHQPDGILRANWAKCADSLDVRLNVGASVILSSSKCPSSTVPSLSVNLPFESNRTRIKTTERNIIEDKVIFTYLTYPSMLQIVQPIALVLGAVCVEERALAVAFAVLEVAKVRVAQRVLCDLNARHVPAVLAEAIL